MTVDVIFEKHLYTVEEFERYTALPGQIDRLLELIHGEIFEKVVTEEHGLIVLALGATLREFVKTHQLGRVGVKISFRSSGDNYNTRLPDISFTTGTDRPVVKEGSVPQMPDLAVEVKSPGNSYVGLRSKAEYMLQNGARLVWLVDPSKQAVEVCTLSNSGEIPNQMRIATLRTGGTLDGGDVLPGFSMPVDSVFDIE